MTKGPGDTARVQKAKADIAQIEGGLELYKLQNLTFPTTSQGLPVAAPIRMRKRRAAPRSTAGWPPTRRC
ncbi:MAG: type II secretion system protein GspG [Proteobacteria bacterium]|nr:type II secretion system protein GspG [Pseudomonadota bacterium]